MRNNNLMKKTNTCSGRKEHEKAKEQLTVNSRGFS